MTATPKPFAVRAAIAASLLAAAAPALAHPGHDEAPGLLADLAHGLGYDPVPVAAATGWLALLLVAGLALRGAGRLLAARRAARRARPQAAR